MATTHTVAQGETLARIAKQHKFASWQTIYNHVENKPFREKRPDPNIIFPGDQLKIPEKEDRMSSGSTNSTHVFRVKKPEIEKFRVKIQNSSGRAWAGKRVVLSVGGQNIDAPIGPNGVLEIELPNGDESEGELKVFMDPNSEEPTHEFEVQLGHLDPVEELSGVQARCNLLGFDCGVADGIMGSKTRTGVKKFQASEGLDVDGVPGPMTKGKLKEVYGC
ncbi:MAG: peptidoglycan-binding protein [Agarilytica sp.]